MEKNSKWIAKQNSQNFLENFSLGDETNLKRFLIYLDEVNFETKKMYIKKLKVFFEFLYKYGIDNPTPNDIRAFKQYLKTVKKLRNNTVNSYLSAVRSYFRFLEDNNLYKDITRNVKSSKKTNELKKDILDINEINYLLSLPKLEGLHGLRDSLILHMLLYTGIRLHSLLELQYYDIIANNNKHVLLYKNKGEKYKESKMPLHSKVVNIYKQYIRALSQEIEIYKDTYLIISFNKKTMYKQLSMPGLKKIIYSYLKRLPNWSKKKLTPHSLRHTFIHNVATKYDVIVAQKLAGHKSIATTQHYLHYNKLQNIDLENIFNK